VSTKLKAKQSAVLREGDIMRVKKTGALVRLILPENPNEEQVLIDDRGYVYVKPVEEIDDWYHISELVRP
jgi:hypothetical protein